MEVACEGGYLTSVFTLTSVSHNSLPHNVVCHAALQSVEQPASKLSGGVDTRENYFSLSPLGPPDNLVAG